MYVQQYTTVIFEYTITNQGDNAYLTTLNIEYPQEANYIRLEDDVCITLLLDVPAYLK